MFPECPQVVIEVDGPSHFAANSRRPLGHTVLRNALLLTACAGAAHAVVLMPHWEWDPLVGATTHPSQTSSADNASHHPAQTAYLRASLENAVAMVMNQF